MAFYYVKTGGTATGDAGRSATARTGSFAAMGVVNYYNSLFDVFAGGVPTTPPDGDMIIVSDLHSEVGAATYRVGVASVTSGILTTLKSVDDNDVTTYKKGASVSTTAGNLEIGSRVNGKNCFLFLGFVLQANDVFDVFSQYSDNVFVDCNISNINGNTPLSSTYQNNLIFRGCTFDIASYLRYNYPIYIYGCIGAIRKGDRYLTDGAGTIYAYDCDFSTSTVPSMTSQAGTVEFHRCKLTDAMLDLSISAEKKTGFAKVNSCSSPSYGGYYYNAETRSSHTYYTDTSIYLNYAYDGTSKSCYRLESKGGVNVANPARVSICDIPAQDLSVTDTTYRVNLLLDSDIKAALSDSEFWIDVSHSDNTELAFGRTVSSRNMDIFSAGTELTSSAETWLGALPVNTKAYHVDVTLTAAQLANVTNSNVIVYAYLAAPNTDVYVCPAVQIGK